jgi:hypothetical protein
VAAAVRKAATNSTQVQGRSLSFSWEMNKSSGLGK